MEDVQSSLIMKFVAEVGEMQNRLNQLESIKAELGACRTFPSDY
jgi:hypothetical protein